MPDVWLVPSEQTIRTIKRAGAWTASRRAGTSSRALEREVRALAAIVDSSDDAILAKTLEGTITSWNGAAEKLYGYTAREIVGENIATLVPPDRPEEVTDILERVRRGERIDHLETVRLCKDGTQIEMSLTISPIRDADGAIVGASSIGRDIRERKEADQLRFQLAAIVDSSDDAILAKTLEGTITSWNGAAEKLYGYTAREIVGENIAMLVPPDRPEEVTDILQRVRRGERIDHLETVRLCKDGTQREMSLTISPIRDADGTIVGASSIGRDIRERKDVEAALAAAHEAQVEANRMKAEQVRLYRELADHDPLTGVLNRRSSSEAIERYLRLAERHGQPLSLAVLDIDHFKQVNDRHGHPLGDAVLRRLAELMIETFRGEDVVSRWGGEEFTIAMYGCGRDDGARRVGDLLEAFTDASISDADAEISGVTFTAGVAEYPTDGDDLQSLYRCADHALATGKTEGRGRVVPIAGGQSRGPTIAGLKAVSDPMLQEAGQDALHFPAEK